jgi:hypothetical protein
MHRLRGQYLESKGKERRMVVYLAIIESLSTLGWLTALVG